MDYRVVALLVFMMSSAFCRPNEWTSWPKCPCTKMYFPLCASNNMTFKSPCEFECYAEVFKLVFNTELDILKEGPCDEDEEYVGLSKSNNIHWGAKQEPLIEWLEKDCPCTSEYQPICSSDMRRYKNTCTYECRINYLIENQLPLIEPVDCKLLPSSTPN